MEKEYDLMTTSNQHAFQPWILHTDLELCVIYQDGEKRNTEVTYCFKPVSLLRSAEVPYLPW
jgi:hypothetical protein